MKKKLCFYFWISFFVSDPGGGINQIPGECTVSGDVRSWFFCQISYSPKQNDVNYVSLWIFSILLSSCRLTPFYKWVSTLLFLHFCILFFKLFTSEKPKKFCLYTINQLVVSHIQCFDALLQCDWCDEETTRICGWHKREHREAGYTRSSFKICSTWWKHQGKACPLSSLPHLRQGWF